MSFTLPSLLNPYLPQKRSNYSNTQFRADLNAGVTVGLVALPLALAIGVASGVRPENSVIAGIVGGTLVSLFGGSRVQIGGPAAAFIGLVFATVIAHGLSGLLIALMMSGFILLAMGLLRMGSLFRFVPEAVITGFTNGIAVLIAVAQIKGFLGLDIAVMPVDLPKQLQSLMHALSTTTWQTALLGMFCLGLLSLNFWTRLPGKLPASMWILLIGTGIGLVFTAINRDGAVIATIGTTFGSFSSSELSLRLPDLGDNGIGARLLTLAGPAIALALLGAIESLLCARMADDLYTKQHKLGPSESEAHDSNRELIGQGIANVITPLFGGIATTGTIARTLTNIRSGAATPVSGIVHAITLLLILVVAAPVAQHIPMTVLAAILLWVAWGILDVRYLAKGALEDRATAALTIVLTLFAGLTPAVFCGVACYWIMKRTMKEKKSV